MYKKICLLAQYYLSTHMFEESPGSFIIRGKPWFIPIGKSSTQERCLLPSNPKSRRLQRRHCTIAAEMDIVLDALPVFFVPGWLANRALVASVSPAHSAKTCCKTPCDKTLLKDAVLRHFCGCFYRMHFKKLMSETNAGTTCKDTVLEYTWKLPVDFL